MFVMFFNGVQTNVKDMNEAVTLIEQEFSKWMQNDDRIVWGNTSVFKELRNEPPNLAWVINEYGEETDVTAYIGDDTNE